MAIFLAVMTMLTALQVMLRYLFNTGLLWSLEATTYCFAWMVLVGMSYCVRTRSHIAIDLLVGRFKPATRRILGLIAVLLCLAYAVMMAIGASEFTHRLFVLGNEARDLPIERWLLTIILPAGFFLLFLRFMQTGIAIWRGETTTLGISDRDHDEYMPEIGPDNQGQERAEKDKKS